MSARSDVITIFRDSGRKFLDSVIPVLEQQRASANVDLYEPVVDEVLGGLFARVFRFLQTFVLDYHLWADDLGRVVLRMMLEAVFYMRFLTIENEPELFLAFQKYGIGQEKLYKMQLRKLVEEGKLQDAPDLREFIDSDSDEEIWDELVNVQLKNFDDLRKLATDAEMKDDYVLHYQPDSTIIHGHWPALRRYYLEQCREPLHRLHLQPSFALPGLNPSLLVRAFDMFMAAYDSWIKRYGLENRVAELVDQYWDGCATAIPDEVVRTEEVEPMPDAPPDKNQA
jgi:hypothetical protein